MIIWVKLDIVDYRLLWYHKSNDLSIVLPDPDPMVHLPAVVLETGWEPVLIAFCLGVEVSEELHQTRMITGVIVTA